MNEYVERAQNQGLIWFPDLEYGHCAIDHAPIKAEYWDEYAELEQTDVGFRINEARAKLVKQFCAGTILDFGIGCGAFMRYHGNCMGFDIDPKSIEWLKTTALWLDPYSANGAMDSIEGVTFWDSLEHVEEPATILSQIKRQIVFVSMPIYAGLDDILQSKHFKRNEHFHYFTELGFIQFMAAHDFHVMAKNHMEEQCGRESIGTFVLRRRAQ